MPTKNHAIEPEELMAYLDGELPASRATAAADHLAHCRECQAIAADLQSVSRRLTAWQVEVPETAMGPTLAKALAGPEGKPVSRSRPTSRVWLVMGLAAACVLVMVIGTLSTSMSKLQVADLVAPVAPLTKPEFQAFMVAPPNQGGQQAQAEPPEPRTANGPLIIQTAQITLTAGDFASVRESLEALVHQHGGHVGQMTVNSPTGSSRSLQATLRIPADHLQAFLTALRKLGRVETESQGGEEVTRQVANLEARLANARITEQRLAEILRQRTGKISDVLEVEKEIGRVRGEIEQMTADRKNFGDRIDFATIQVSISEEYHAALQSPSSFGQLRNAAVEGYRNVTGSLVAASLFLLSAGPTLLVWAAILFFPSRYLWRRYRRAR